MQDSTVSVRQDVELILIKIRNGRIDRPLRYVDIYYKRPNLPHDETKKPELAWIASGLPVGQKIYITAKAGTYFGYMKQECYVIERSDKAVYSEPVTRETPPDGVIWSYGVTLTDATGAPLDSYDPDIHINNDP